MKQPGRNEPCPCNSGKKFKRCHGSGDRQQQLAIAVREIAALAEAQAERRKQVQGLGKPIISVQHVGHRVVAVADRIMASDKWQTFHDFLTDYIKTAIGEEWGTAEIKKPLGERHPILIWYDAVCALQRHHIKKPGEVYTYQPTGAAWAYLWLAYDLYCIDHNAELKRRLLDRLRDKKEFHSARYELSVAATLVRGGFQIEFENEDDRRSTHCEFTATATTGRKFSVECKRREPEVEEAEFRVAKLGRKLHRALSKKADHARVVFIDLNHPDSSRDQERPKWVDLVLSQVRKFERNLANGGALPPAYVFITNYPYHHHLDSTQIRCAILGEGFKVPDFKVDTVFQSIRDAVAARDRHIEMRSLLKSMQKASIPSRFEEDVPAFGEGNALDALRVGSEYRVPDPQKNPRIALLQTVEVDWARPAVRCGLTTGSGQALIESWPLTADEIAAYSARPSELNKAFEPRPKVLKDAIELFDFLFAVNRDRSFERLLEQCATESDLADLAKLSHIDLARVCAERQANWVLIENEKRKKEVGGAAPQADGVATSQ